MKYRGVFIALILWLGFILIVSNSVAATVNVSWDAPTERVDGTPLEASEIGEYRVYYRSNGIERMASTTSTSMDITELYGLYVFQVTTVDTNGLESERSAEHEITVVVPIKVQVDVKVSCLPPAVCL